jgi:transposase-like protein
MKKTKHTEEKIIGAVKQLEAGRSAKEIARELGVADQTLYPWKTKYSGMDVSHVRTGTRNYARHCMKLPSGTGVSGIGGCG